MILEALLRYGPENPDLKRKAAEKLAGSSLFDPELHPRSILTVLAVRAEYLVKREGVSCRAPVAPDPDSPLADLVRDLKSEPEKIPARCPY